MPNTNVTQMIIPRLNNLSKIGLSRVLYKDLNCTAIMNIITKAATPTIRIAETIRKLRTSSKPDTVNANHDDNVAVNISIINKVRKASSKNDPIETKRVCHFI
jgi:hypothetical protein